jgi:hypothetical protein
METVKTYIIFRLFIVKMIVLEIMDDWINGWITALKGLHIYEPHDYTRLGLKVE